MIGITYEDFLTMIDAETLLHDLLENEGYENGDREWETWTKYWNVVEKICQWKDKFVHDWEKERGER